MNKKIKNIIILIILILLTIFLIIMCTTKEKSSYPFYTCKTTSKGNLTSNIIYTFYYDETTNQIKKFEITKEYIAKNSSGEYDLSTLVNIIKKENNTYKTYKNVNIEVLNNSKNIYKYEIIIETSKIKSNKVLEKFNNYKNLEEQLNYFQEQKIKCQSTKKS